MTTIIVPAWFAWIVILTIIPAVAVASFAAVLAFAWWIPAIYKRWRGRVNFRWIPL